MRVLLVSHARNDPNAGASRVYHLLEEGLTERGHSVKTLHYEDFGIAPAVERVLSRLFINQVASHRAAKEALNDYDVILTSSGILHPLFKKLHSKPRRPLLVSHMHGSAFFDHQARLDEAARGHVSLSWMYRLVTGPMPVHADMQGCRFADLTITQNKRDQDYFLDQGIDRVLTIPLPVHPAIQQASPSAPAITSRNPKSLFWFASWTERKGCYYLPRAFRIIADRHPDATLTIGGVGANREAIQKAFHPSLHARLRFLPRLTLEEHIAHLREHSIFLFPSLSEGFGLAALEALSMGLATVTTKVGIGADLLEDGKSALLVPPASALHLAEATIALIEQDDLRCKVSTGGKQLAAQLTFQRFIDSYESVFEAYRHHETSGQPALTNDGRHANGS